MDWLNNLALGFSVAFTDQNLLCAFFGCVLGTLIGVLPGIGPAATVAMLLPSMVSLDVTPALIMLDVHLLRRAIRRFNGGNDEDPTQPAKNEPALRPTRPRRRGLVGPFAGHRWRFTPMKIRRGLCSRWRRQTAVLRAVINARQHDQRGRDIERNHRRQQHRDRGRRPMPGKTPIKVPSTQPKKAQSRF